MTRQHEKPIIKVKGFSRLELHVSFPIPQITTILLLVHLGLGCCLHHAHTYVATCHETLAATADSWCCDTHADNEGTHECGRCGHSDAPPTGKESKSHRHHCDGDRCSFVRSELLPEQRGESRFDLCPLDVALSLTNIELLHSCQTVGSDHSLCGGGLPVRAHLLFSVLLI